jgi:replicative DNA helicase
VSIPELPPHNIDAEAKLLGNLMIDPACLDDVRPLVQPTDFYRDSHQAIARVIFDLHDRGIQPGGLAVCDELARLGLLAGLGGDDAIAEILEGLAYFDVMHLTAIVTQTARVRDLIEASHETIRECHKREFPADELAARAEARVYAVGDTLIASDGPVDPATRTPAILERFNLRRQGQRHGLASGLMALDKLTDGMTPGQLVVIGARPSIGKTAMALTIARHAAYIAGVPTLMFSLEMSADEITERLIVMGAKVDGQKLKTGLPLARFEEDAIQDAAAQVSQPARLRIDDRGMNTPERIASVARRHQQRYGLGLVVVDYLQLIEPPGGTKRGTNRQEQVTEISKRLKGLARTLKVPVLCLSQLNRNAETRADKKPTMSDLRESGAIEQDADVVMLLHRPEFYDPNERPGQADLIVEKNRNGRTGPIKLTYIKQSMLFMDYADAY